MSTVILEQEASKLDNLDDVVIVRDLTGRILGRFIPEPTPITHEDLRIPLSDGELARRESIRDGFTSTQVLAYLKSLEESR